LIPRARECRLADELVGELREQKLELLLGALLGGRRNPLGKVFCSTCAILVTPGGEH
jgi:hypothetical protein